MSEPIRIENEYVYRLFEPESGFQAGEIGSLQTRQKLSLTGCREFALLTGSPGDIRPSTEVSSRNCDLMDTKLNGDSVEFSFRRRDVGLDIALVVSAGPGPQISKKLSVTNTGSANVVLFDVVLDRFHLAGNQLSGGGRGWPVSVGNFAFAAVEFPEAENIVDEGMLSLEYYPAVTIRPGESYDTEPSMFRFALSGVETGILEHIPTLRSGNPRRLEASYSTQGAHENEGAGGDIVNAQLDYVIDLKSNWRVPLNYFLIDGVWWSDSTNPVATGRFEGIDEEKRFLNGCLGRILEKASAAGIKVGLRFSLGCPASAEVVENLRKSIPGLVSRYGLKLVKLTGGVWSCENTDHGHIPGKYARYAAAKNLMDVVAAIREVDQDTIVQLSGSARSPWWLRYVDYLVGGRDDPSDIPAPSLRDSQILHTDLDYRLFELDGGTCISYSDCSFWCGKQSWRKSAVMSLARNGRLCLSGELQLLDDNDRLFLQRLMDVRTAYRVAVRSIRRVLGDPAKGEIHGYASVVGGKGLVALSNPSWNARVMKVSADQLGCDPSTRNLCVRLFPDTGAWSILPFGEFSLHMNPWEVCYLEVGPSEAHSELLESKAKRSENYPIHVSSVEPPSDGESEIALPLEAIDFETGCMYRTRPSMPRNWEAFPLQVDLRGLRGELYINNRPLGIRDDHDFAILYPWTARYGCLQFGEENLVYLATRKGAATQQSDLKLRPLPYYSSSACREDWPHPGSCSMVAIVRYLKDGEPHRPSLDPNTAQCAVWLDGVWMDPYRVPPLVPRIWSGFSWSVFMLDLEGDWECVRILVPKLLDCDYEVDFFLTDRLKAAAYMRGE